MTAGLALALAAAVGPWGCTLERRADLGRSETAGGAGTDTVAPRSGRAPAGDSARAVVAALHEALLLGDGARVAALSASGAVMVDQEEGVRWHREAGSDASLPGALPRTGRGLEWVPVASDFTPLGEAGLLVNRYRAAVAGEEVPWVAVESVVLLRTDEGWRIRYLHRSRGREES